jgi:hypothetical protein
MRLGAGLIAFGALSIPLFQMTGVLDGQTATAAFAVATGVIEGVRDARCTRTLTGTRP